MSYQNDIRKNGSGYNDPTAYKAIQNVENRDTTFHTVLDTIFNVCEVSDFCVENRIVLRDKKTGKVWK